MTPYLMLCLLLGVMSGTLDWRQTLMLLRLIAFPLAAFLAFAFFQ